MAVTPFSWFWNCGFQKFSGKCCWHTANAASDAAACAKASEAQMEALLRFANAYGMLFQITDDILDCTGDAALLGKTVGKDEAEGKVTFVSVYGLEGAKTRAQSYAKIAQEAVSSLRSEPTFFSELIAYTLTRRS